MAGALDSAEVLAEAGSAAVEALADGGGPRPMPVTMGRPLPTGNMVTPTTAPRERPSTPRIAHGAGIRKQLEKFAKGGK